MFRRKLFDPLKLLIKFNFSRFKLIDQKLLIKSNISKFNFRIRNIILKNNKILFSSLLFKLLMMNLTVKYRQIRTLKRLILLIKILMVLLKENKLH